MARTCRVGPGTRLISKAGASFPELILVGSDEKEPFGLLEGHLRLTASFPAPERIPPPLPLIIS